MAIAIPMPIAKTCIKQLTLLTFNLQIN
jgi:hypothetical protein